MVHNISELKLIIDSGASISIDALSVWIGKWDIAIRILFVMIAVDYLSGLMKGAAGGGLSSDIGHKGLIKKATIFMIVLISYLVDIVALNEIPVFRTGTTYFYIANEGISILENAAAIGVPIPEVISKTLMVMKDSSGKDNDPIPKES